MKLKIAAICGGYSSEYVISMKSVETIITNLDNDKYDVYKVKIDQNEWICYDGNKISEINQKDFTARDGLLKFDFAFIMIHGTPGEDGKLQAYFDMLNMPYSTCNHLMSTITFNKWSCNHLLKSLGFLCPESMLIRKNQTIDENKIEKKIGFPMFIKPSDGGSSFGVTKVKKREDIIPAINKALKEGTEALIEAFIEGIELTCGVYFNGKSTVVLPVTQIMTQNEFFDYNAKYAGESTEETPAKIPDELRDKLQGIVKNVFECLGLKGMARIDFMVKNETPYLIEINTVPGFSPASIVPQQIKAFGLSIQQVLDEIIQAGMQDY